MGAGGHLNETATKIAWTRTSREMHGNRPRGTKLVHGKLKMISSKEASWMKMKKKLSIWQVLNCTTPLPQRETREELLQKREQPSMSSRVVVVAIIRKVQTRKVQGAGKGKSKGQGKNRNCHGRAPGQSSNASTSQAAKRPHKPMPSSTIPCLKCGSRDRESGKCPKNQEHRSYNGFRRDKQ